MVITAAVVLSIIDTNLKIVLDVVQNMTPEQKQKLWDEHVARQAKWEALLDKLHLGDENK